MIYIRFLSNNFHAHTFLSTKNLRNKLVLKFYADGDNIGEAKTRSRYILQREREYIRT